VGVLLSVFFVKGLLIKLEAKHEERNTGVIAIGSNRNVERWRNGHLGGCSLSLAKDRPRDISLRLTTKKHSRNLNKLSKETHAANKT